LLYLLSGIGGGISEYVWMAVNQFLAKAVADILDIESFFFLADLGVKDDEGRVLPCPLSFTIIIE